MAYDPKDYPKCFAKAEDTQAAQAAEVAPVTRADEAAAKWAAAHNYCARCEVQSSEASERYAKAVAEEQAAFHALEVAAGRAPETGQAVPSLGLNRPFDPRLR